MTTRRLITAQAARTLLAQDGLLTALPWYGWVELKTVDCGGTRTTRRISRDCDGSLYTLTETATSLRVITATLIDSYQGE